ncbi:hypothetical protein C1H46_016756 [Malus baccata]|uniref:Uncharacterized protein n=1 Tax=Malus baccata TaxID=106549 RepID=A0A540MGX8_MALBA|nr:hypothetical protein C1H46_016756 [Malus baccata]
MALNESGPDQEDEELERQVDEMAKKVLEYRATLPVQLKNTVASILAVQRPVFLDGSGPGTPELQILLQNKLLRISGHHWPMEIKLLRGCNCIKIKFPATLLPCLLF